VKSPLRGSSAPCFGQEQARAITSLRKCLKTLSQITTLHTPVSSLRVNENGGAFARALAHQYHPGTADGCAVRQIAYALAGDNAFRRKTARRNWVGWPFSDRRVVW